MSKMSFTAADGEKLIYCVSKQQVLYDTRHTDYRNALAKENAWKSIEQELGISSEECKKKWKFIRDGYQRYKKKNRFGTAAPKNSKYKRHQQLWFLDDISQRRTLNTGADNPEPTSQPPCKTEQETIDDETSDDEEGQETSNITEFLDINNIPDLPEQRPRAKRMKRGVKDEKAKKLRSESEDTRQDVIRNTIVKKEDDVELFCRHIAEVLRKLPPVFKAEAKKDIGILVSNYEIKAAQISVPESKD